MRVALLLLLVAGCSMSDPPECRLNSDCPSGQVCNAEACVPECREDRDCPSNERCVDQRCISPGPTERLCHSARDCRTGETCSGGVCGIVSLVDRDGGVSRDTGTPPPDGGPDGSVAPDGATSGVQYGGVCTSGPQCVSGLCLGPSGSSSGRCTKVCVTNADCFYPDTCIEIPGAGKLCAQESVGNPAGAPCPGGPNDCSSGLCLDLGGSPVCTVECSPLPTCPPNMVCLPIPDGSGGAVAVCAPGTGLGFGEACSSGGQCVTTLCVGVAGSAQGVCTSLCHQVPCPTGYTCTPIPDGSGGTSSVCAPDGAVGGNYGATCTGASSCSSGLCLNDARTGQAFCTIQCVSPSDCSAISGMTCVILQGGTQVCGPP